jgi:roadblock/LC7 domain-containing protein
MTCSLFSAYTAAFLFGWEIQTMATLDELAQIDGVVVAFEFAPDGKLLRHKGNAATSPEMAALAAQFCAAVTMSFDTVAKAFTKLTNTSWLPQHGWVYSGGDYTVVIGSKGYKGLFIKTNKADPNQLFQLLSGDL